MARKTSSFATLLEGAGHACTHFIIFRSPLVWFWPGPWGAKMMFLVGISKARGVGESTEKKINSQEGEKQGDGNSSLSKWLPRTASNYPAALQIV